eukprot:9749826-Prorocentrum_lima.AAC.1
MTSESLTTYCTPNVTCLSSFKASLHSETYTAVHQHPRQRAHSLKTCRFRWQSARGIRAPKRLPGPANIPMPAALATTMLRRRP